MHAAVEDAGANRGRLMRNLVVAAATVVLSFLALMLLSGDAQAAGCCKAQRDGKTMVITGTVPYKGTEFITAFIKDSRGREASGQKCAFSAGKGKATVTIKVPAKYVPNGKWRVVAASANSKFTKFYSTPSETFRIKNSPGVHVEITEKPEKTTDSTTARFEFRKAGAVKKIRCSMDGGAWQACTSPVVYEGLEEGQHVYKVRVSGSDSYVWTDKHTFTVQAAQTFAVHKVRL